MRIYYSHTGRPSKDLAEAALLEHLGKTDELLHESNGHPYFKHTDLSVSISHSSGLWVCVLSDVNAGIDIEKIKERSWEKLAARYFTDVEKETVREQGIIGFYRIWTMKEAFAKYSGKGLINSLNSEVADVNIEYINRFEGYICALCTKEKEGYEINEIV